MKIIAIKIDETADTQDIYSPELDMFLQIAIIAPAQAEASIQDWQARLDAAQKRVAVLKSALHDRDAHKEMLLSLADEQICEISGVVPSPPGK